MAARSGHSGQSDIRAPLFTVLRFPLSPQCAYTADIIMLGSLGCRTSLNALPDRPHPGSRLAPTGDGEFLRLLELLPTWAVYSGLTGLDHGLAVVSSGPAAQLGGSGGARGQVRNVGSTESDVIKEATKKDVIMMLPAPDPARAPVRPRGALTSPRRW